ncbi:MAG: type II secretion system F family protein [Anaerolineales bacterium]|nr:type II secretion system F family protein [Anaerolineales bacterium]
MLIAVFIGIVVIGAAALVYAAVKMPKDQTPLDARLSEYAGREVPISLEEIELQQPFHERVILPILKGISDLIVRFTPAANIQTIQKKLDLAGNPWGVEAPVYWSMQIVFAVLFGGVLSFLFLFGTWRPQWFIAIGLVIFGLVFGYFFPRLYLDSRIARRQENVRKAMPDALDLLTICVEAGLGFDSAMSKVTEEWENELSMALGRVIQEIRLGKLRRDALRDMAERIGISEMTSFVAAVIQSEQLGVSMSRVLRIQADQMRMRRRQRAEEKARQAPVKMMIPLVFLIFPSILIVLLGPAGLILFTSPVGKMFFGGG